MFFFDELGDELAEGLAGLREAHEGHDVGQDIDRVLLFASEKMRMWDEKKRQEGSKARRIRREEAGNDCETARLERAKRTRY